MEYELEITLDLNTKAPYAIIYTKQGDADSRYVIIHITKDGKDYPIAQSSTALFRFKKPDGHQVVQSGVINEDGSVSVLLSEQILAQAGKGYADLVIYGANGSVLSTISFIVSIMSSPDIDYTQVVMSDSYTDFKNTVDSWDRTVAEAQAWANGHRGSTPVSSSDAAYHNNAKYWSEQAAENGEAWANGTRNGVAVTSSDPAYNKNSKYYNEQAVVHEHKSQEYSYDSEAWARGTYNGVDASSDTVYYHNNSKYYAEQAEISKNAVENMQVEATTLGPNQRATVTKTVTSGVAKLSFGLPQGVMGDATFVTFDVDYNSGQLIMYKPEASSFTDQITFQVNENDGMLEVKFNV